MIDFRPHGQSHQAHKVAACLNLEAIKTCGDVVRCRRMPELELKRINSATRQANKTSTFKPLSQELSKAMGHLVDKFYRVEAFKINQEPADLPAVEALAPKLATRKEAVADADVDD